MATIKEVARQSGVSVATVSRYMNKSGYVGKETAKKIQKVIDELGYEPNEVARSLFQKKSKLIGLLIPDITNPFFPLLAKGVEDGLNNYGYTLMLGNVEGNQSKLTTYLSTFVNNNVAGIISAVPIGDKRTQDIPYIAVDRLTQDEKYSVTADSYLGGKLQAEAILNTNYGKIVVMLGPTYLLSTQERLRGIKEVFEENQISYDLFYTDTHDYEQSYEIIQRMFREFPDMDTILASNDLFALNIMKEIAIRNLKIPEDIQIIGYDNISFSRIAQPQLATVSQFSYRQGQEAAKILLDIIEHGKSQEQNIVLPTEYIEGCTLRIKE